MVSESGDSSPRGSILVIEPEMDAQPGDYVIVLNDADQTTFKQLFRDGGDLLLKTLNARYPIKPPGTATIIGVVSGFSKRHR